LNLDPLRQSLQDALYATAEDVPATTLATVLDSLHEAVQDGLVGLADHNDTDTVTGWGNLPARKE
jgi:hypothetical protein